MCLEKLRSLKTVFFTSSSFAFPWETPYSQRMVFKFQIKGTNFLSFFSSKSTIKLILSALKKQDSGWWTLFEIFGLVISNLFSDSQIIYF